MGAKLESRNLPAGLPLHGAPPPFMSFSTSAFVAIGVSFGLLRRGYGNLCSIPACCLAPGQRALNSVTVLLRLDRLDAK